ncbi:MAG TPA: glycoside hydrolase family 1 protein [Thermoleophilaceae bacterium]|nr:glycoside hydrolase family 1 protein [Thermoleophilaceae bacterium]
MRRLLGPLPLVLALLCAWPAVAPAATGGKFPRSFLWGTAVAGFQTEMGGSPANRDRGSDWWTWAHDRGNIAERRVSGDLPERGPGHWRRWRSDVDLAARRLHSNAFRMSVEWSRIFPRSTRGIETGRNVSRRDLRRLDRRANRSALAHYAAVIRRARRRGMRVLLTVNHFTLPNWIHDSIAARRALEGRDPDGPLPPMSRPAGWLDSDTVDEFRKYAAYLAWKLGRQVDIWTPINEPLVVATNGYANVPGVIGGFFPPGAFSFTAAITAVLNLERGNAAAYDAIKRWDRHSRVGLVQNLVAFTPADQSSDADRRGAVNADYLFNRLFVNAAVRGRVDRNANGTIEPSEVRTRGRRKADFIGVNYYFRGRVQGLPTPLSSRIPVLDFLPQTDYRTPQKPTSPPCPTECSEFGNEIYPEGLRTVLGTAGRLGLPVIITENGLADSDDDQRSSHLIRHLRVLRQAMNDRVARVQGYLHWSLFDNFEWSAGYYPRFGLFRIDSRLRRRARPSANVFARIARRNRVP